MSFCRMWSNICKKRRLVNNIDLFNKRSYVEFNVHTNFVQKWTQNDSLRNWVNERIQLFQPTRVHLCDGSEDEYDQLINRQIQTGTLIKLNPQIRPDSYVARSSQLDVARVEECTFVCSESKSGSGPTNNWEDPEKMYLQMEKLFTGSMRGRTMYVVPFCMGPLDSSFAQYGVQVTDSPYVVCAMRTMTRMGQEVLNELQRGDRFWVPCVHSLGAPLNPQDEDSSWPCNSNKKIVHFPEERRIWSYGSGYGGNAILGKKCLALRIGSTIAREENWLAEHMLIIGVTNPKGIKKYFLGCFPSACGKTNLAMLQSSLPGWKVETIGDDIAWLRVNEEDGRIYAINPENGFFGVAPGTGWETNPVAMSTIKQNTIFTNVAITKDGDVWWEGMTRDPPTEAISWTRQEWGPASLATAAHPNARFCVSIKQCPTLDVNCENPKGVPISAILFGGRRSTTVPLVFQSFDWNHGVFLGSSMSSETTAAAAGLRGILRIDPFSMRPFCGYNMADYFTHWLNYKNNSTPEKLPKFFFVNWFRKERGKFLWPGYGENMRVIKWIFDRCDKDSRDLSTADESAIGMVPRLDSFDTHGMQNFPKENLSKVFEIDHKSFLKETNATQEFYEQFADKISDELWSQLDHLKQRLQQSIEKEQQ